MATRKTPDPIDASIAKDEPGSPVDSVDLEPDDAEELTDENRAIALAAQRAQTKAALEGTLLKKNAPRMYNNIGAVLKNQPQFEIIINEGSGKADESQAFVGVNGYAFEIRRGTPVIVPEAVVNVLKQAKQIRVRSRRDEYGRDIQERYEVLTWPFQVLRSVSVEEANAKRAEQRAKAGDIRLGAT